jgi:hypothetical protein
MWMGVGLVRLPTLSPHHNFSFTFSIVMTVKHSHQLDECDEKRKMNAKHLCGAVTTAAHALQHLSFPESFFLLSERFQCLMLLKWQNNFRWWFFDVSSIQKSGFEASIHWPFPSHPSFSALCSFDVVRSLLRQIFITCAQILLKIRNFMENWIIIFNESFPFINRISSEKQTWENFPPQNIISNKARKTFGNKNAIVRIKNISLGL